MQKSKHLELKAPREIIGETLVTIGEKNSKLIVIDSDLGRSTRLQDFEKKFPDRFFQLGSTEENAISFSCGLSYAGYKAVFVSFTMFAIGLPWTQVRMAAYSGCQIVILATHPGFDIGPDGGTHQMLEDTAIARVIPELVVLSPSDSQETKAAIKIAINNNKIVYVRIGRHPVPSLHSEPVAFEIGKAELIVNKGRDLVLVSDGSMTYTAIEVAKKFLNAGIETSVVNIRSIKPLDEKLIRELAHQAKLIVTIENHSVLGGLGSAVAEIASEEGGKVYRIGSPDCFGESATTDELREFYSLDIKGVYKKIESNIKQQK